jgi:hypothetical protein
MTSPGRCIGAVAASRGDHDVASFAIGGVTVGDARRFRVDALEDAELDASRIDPGVRGPWRSMRG